LFLNINPLGSKVFGVYALTCAFFSCL